MDSSRTSSSLRASTSSSLTHDDPSDEEAISPSFPAGISTNGLSGALAGVCVTMCLHPIDTVKVVVQSDAGRPRGALAALGLIIRNRGPLGLYSGVLPSLATSAPISAIYTATYEAVKAALLPHCPPGASWVAHCAGGACASVATSFVFTPSEVVKSRVQVGQYATAPRALVGVVANEGVGAMYRGWGAVLARNIPQSALKFLVYERLREVFLSSASTEPAGASPAAPPPPLTTAVLGAVAGCSAAFCTTPFDVAKTRMQTQGALRPGLPLRGLGATLAGILRAEGVGGLYRGLGPRLAIYLFQGALFFGTYEFFREALGASRVAPVPRLEWAAASTAAGAGSGARLRRGAGGAGPSREPSGGPSEVLPDLGTALSLGGGIGSLGSASFAAVVRALEGPRAAPRLD